MKVDLKLEVNDEIGKMCMGAFKELTTDELPIAMAEVALLLLEKMAYRPLPVMPYKLQLLRDTMATPSWKKQKEEDRTVAMRNVMSDPAVKSYVDQESKTNAENFSNAHALEQHMATFLAWDEAEKGVRCWNVYKEFPNELKLSETGGVIWRKKTKGFASA